MKKNILGLTLLLLLGYGCKKGASVDENINNNIVKDIDGNVYNVIKIGSRTWMTENLKVVHYRNGDPIQNITDATEWSQTYKTQTGAYCDYENNSSNSQIYGKLYNWYSVNDKRNIAPVGWHVPNESEWVELLLTLGPNSAGGKLKETGTVHWKDPNIGATNEVGFSALPGGMRFDMDGTFNFFGSEG